MAYLIETDTGPANLTGRTNIGSYTSNQSDAVLANVLITGLNGAAANITIDWDYLIGATTYEGGTIVRPKKNAADTTFAMVLGPFPLNSAGALRIYATSTNGSDTTTTSAVEFYDLTQRDVINAEADTALTDYDGVVLTDLDVDGVSYAQAMEIMLAVLSGVATPSGSDVAFKQRDGSTTSITITYGSTDGERTGSVIS